MPKKAYREGHKAVSRPKGLGDVQPSSKNMARSFSLPGHINSSPVEEDSIGGASVVSTLSANHKDIITGNHTSGKGESVHNGIKDHLRSKFKFHAHVHAQDSNNSIQVLSLNKPRGHFFFRFRSLKGLFHFVNSFLSGGCRDRKFLVNATNPRCLSVIRINFGIVNCRKKMSSRP